jgi:hypothetical protein
MHGHAGTVSLHGGEKPTTAYEIVVRGRLGDKLAQDLGARCFELRPDCTLLVVEIIDQSHLHGVLDRLRDLNVEIDRVNPV